MASDAESGSTPSAWAPFRQRAFTVLWTATVISNVGTWMNDVGAGWLMSELSPSPAVVAAVQAATTLPVFLFALLAGAVADIVDRRRMLLVINLYLALVAFAFTFMVWRDLITPIGLLAFTFLLGTGAAFMAPAWQAIVPRLVPKPDLTAAISLNSMGINISRAIGPALAGVLIAAFGLASPFLLNAVSILFIIAALLWWKPQERPTGDLPPEHVFAAMVAGVRYGLNSRPLKLTLVRAFGFFIFASAYWAMLPLIAREVLEGGATLYGVLLGGVGAGAVIGALLLPRIRQRLGPDLTVAGGALGTALVLLLFAAAPVAGLAIAASLLAGMCWIAVLSSLNVAAQTALPDWVRARGLAVFLTVFFGAMSLGSAIWGQVASATSVRTALVIAACGSLAAIPLTWRAKLARDPNMDLTPSMHWPEPHLGADGAGAAAPAMVEVSYRVEVGHVAMFEGTMEEMRRARRRNGGYRWNLLRDAEDPTRFVETWFESSWVDHLRHHERVTGDDQHLQQDISELLAAGTEPEVRHYVSGSQ